MVGNLFSWVQDWYHDSYDGAPKDASAWEDPAGSRRVLRGGKWNNYERGARFPDRVGGFKMFTAVKPLRYIGFRPVKSK